MDLKLDDLIRLVLTHNESVQVRLLEMEIARRKYRAERGIFEPELVVDGEHQDNQRQTTSQDYFFGRGITNYLERNNIYSAGIETLVPSGARIRLGYSLRDLRNSYQDQGFVASAYTNGEYVSFMGISAVQPLLKGAWMPANMANIRLAAISSETAFQEYRRQLMLILSTAQASYWNLYLAQEQMLSLRQSVDLAESILQDNQARLEVGRGSELEVLEAQSGLALRRSKQSEARQLFFEAVNRLTALYSESVISTNKTIIAVENPEVIPTELDFFGRWQYAFNSNPDYLIQRQKIVSENIKLAYAKNQRLPQLDLKASYGLNGLGGTPGESWDDIEKSGYPSWTVGVEMRIPLGGGTKTRNELKAAKLRQKQTLISLKELETQIANALDISIHKARSARDDIRNYQTVVTFNESLLETRLAQLKAGKVESRKVLEIEAELLEAKIALAEARVKYRRALLELELVQGSSLDSLNVDLTQKELERHTSRLLKHGDLTDERYDQFIKEVQMAYLGKRPAMDAPMSDHAREVLRETTAALNEREMRSLTPEEQQKAFEMLRKVNGDLPQK